MSGRTWAEVLRKASWIVANGGVVPDGYKEMFDKAADFLERSSDSTKPLAWTKERPTEPGLHLIFDGWVLYMFTFSQSQIDDPENPGIEWGPRFMRFGPIPEAREPNK